MNKRINFSVILCVCALMIKSQIMLNGSFALGTLSWGCSAETNAETVYGGSNGLNAVAEVDAAAGLCQTVIGLGVGNIYTLSYQCTRRTGGCPSPNPTNLNVTVSGGALSKTDIRSNGTFGFTTTSYNFTALSTSHTITFAAGSGFGGSTCGMIVDNISVTLFSLLPIELLYFNATVLDEGAVLTNWETASELNNDFFTIEKSTNSLDWEIVGILKGAGTTSQRSNYNYTDYTPYFGTSYYRLRQTDFNGNFKYSEIQSVDMQKRHDVFIFPNPSVDHLLSFNPTENSPYSICLYNSLGQLLFSSYNHLTNDINLSSIDAGIYNIVISKNENVIYRSRIILQ